MAFVNEFFTTGRFVKTINQPFIVLIPKRADADCFEAFRPISLCNFCYKVISKILANRIMSVLHEIISLFQLAFV